MRSVQYLWLCCACSFFWRLPLRAGRGFFCVFWRKYFIEKPQYPTMGRDGEANAQGTGMYAPHSSSLTRTLYI